VLSTTREEGGSVLVLMPVAALIFVILGALALDATVVFLAERELAGAAAAAANDAVTRGIDEDEFYRSGCVVVLPGAAAEVVRTSVAAKRLDRTTLSLAAPQVDVTGGAAVTVTLRGVAPRIFVKALPGAASTAPVSATATATARTADGVAAGC
jgi:Flp pilus assembly protein TadG